MAFTTLTAFACREAPSGVAPENQRGNGSVLWTLAGHGWVITPAFDSATVYFGGFAHDLLAVDKATRSVRWHVVTGMGGRATAGHNVVLAGETVAMGDVDVFAYDRRTGAPKWVFRPSDLDETGTTILATDGATFYAASFRGRAYAIDPATGQARWITTLATDSSTKTFNATVTDGVMYVGIKRFRSTNAAIRGALAALDAQSGRVLWQSEFAPEVEGQASGSFGTAVSSGGVVVSAAEDGRVYGLDRATGAVRWTAPRVHRVPSEDVHGVWNDSRWLARAGGVVVVTSLTGTVVGLEPATGRERWRVYAGAGSILDPAATDDSTAYVTSGGQITAVDVRSGAVLWRRGGVDVDGAGLPYFASPAAIDGARLYVAGERGYYALQNR